jgi:hypothetical protein
MLIMDTAVTHRRSLCRSMDFEPFQTSTGQTGALFRGVDSSKVGTGGFSIFLTRDRFHSCVLLDHRTTPCSDSGYIYAPQPKNQQKQ